MYRYKQKRARKKREVETSLYSLALYNAQRSCSTKLSLGTLSIRIAVFVVGEGGFEPPKALLTDLQSAPFGHSGIPPYELCRLRSTVEPVDGLEPPTC